MVVAYLAFFHGLQLGIVPLYLHALHTGDDLQRDVVDIDGWDQREHIVQKHIT